MEKEKPGYSEMRGRRHGAMTLLNNIKKRKGVWAKGTQGEAGEKSAEGRRVLAINNQEVKKRE